MTNQPAQPHQTQPAPAKKKTPLSVALVLIAVVLVAVGIPWFLSRDAASQAKVGDCVRTEGTDSVVVVQCSDAAAEYKVLGRIDGISENEFGVAGLNSPCSKDYPDATAHYWQGPANDRNADGWVLCLAAAKA